MEIIHDIASGHEDRTALRRDIHAHPELGFEEQRTAGIVAAELRRMGVTTLSSPLGCGVSYRERA